MQSPAVSKQHLLLTFFCFLLLFCACSRYRLPPPTAFDLSGLDTSPLREKVIVLDPGHGGTESGAVGKMGLKESEVNLGVAFHLWGLLKAAGAVPFLTRHTDGCVYPQKDFNLKKDLQARCDFSNTKNTDFFLSIHHNAAIKNRRINDLILFYKTGDAGQSRDAAGAMLNPLRTTLGTENASIRAGNFHVLRNTIATAVLGEASFMSNRKNEKALSFQRTVMREARGYFLGILNYFKRGIPTAAILSPQDTVLNTATPEIIARVDSGNSGAFIRRKDIFLSLNRQKISSFSYENNKISYTPPGPLENRQQTVCISARNSAGNISRKACTVFNISRPPARMTVRPLFAAVPANGTARDPVDITVLDQWEKPVADHTEIHFSASDGFFLEKTARTLNGHARATFIAPEKPGAVHLYIKTGSVRVQTTVTCDRSRDAYFTVTLRNTDGCPVTGAALLKNKQPVDYSDAGGFVYDRTQTDFDACYQIRKQGYLPLNLCPQLLPGKVTVHNLVLKPVDRGIFFNKKIILDPFKPDLPIIAILKKRIEQAGGKVILTGKNGAGSDTSRKIARVSKTGADLLLSFESSTSGTIGHYYRSARGKRLAETLCEHLNRRDRPEKYAAKTTAKPIVARTPMPAVNICIIPFENETPGLSEALYRALLVFFARSPS